MEAVLPDDVVVELQSEPRRTENDFIITGLEDRPRFAGELRRMARTSKNIILERGGISWDQPALLVWTDARTYAEQTGFRAESTAAAASARRRTIWINESAWMGMPEAARQETLTHELGHLVVGNLAGGKPLPVWANEGIVMHLAGQEGLQQEMQLLAAHAVGALPRLEDLEETFPRDSGAQGLAYRMAYAAIEVVSASYGDQPGSVRRLVSRLNDPFWGPITVDELWDPFRRDGWEMATEASMGSRLSTGVIVMSSTGAIFVVMAILLIVAVFARRRRVEQWNEREREQQEPWEESLTQADVRDIYGDPEDFWERDAEER